jgi:hypothetical protein
MPEWDEIPKQFFQDQNAWNKWATKWFFRGLREEDMPTPKEGISLDVALKHLTCILSTLHPKHEHKEAAVAYLASLWFVEPTASNQAAED